MLMLLISYFVRREIYFEMREEVSLVFRKYEREIRVILAILT